jgi:hypothetical protein
MTNPEFEALRRFAASTRNRGGFGVPYATLDGNDGKWGAGRKGTDIKGRHLVAATTDVMHGHQKFVDNKPIYSVGRIADGFVPDRDKLGDHDEMLWPKKGKDPWQLVVFMPMFDPETHEPFLFTSTNNGGRDAVGSLVGATLDNEEAHPEDAGKIPLVELGVDSYKNTRGKTIFYPLFDIIKFVEMPAAILRIKPPPPFLAIEDHSQPAAETIPPADVVEASAAPKPPPKQKPQTKPATKYYRDDMDDEIPF